VIPGSKPFRYSKRGDVAGGDVKLDFEHEAAQMLARTLENFLLCTGSRHPGHYAFTSKKVANWRAKQAAV
jgi:hypothetical protein